MATRFLSLYFHNVVLYVAWASVHGVDPVLHFIVSLGRSEDLLLKCVFRALKFRVHVPSLYTTASVNVGVCYTLLFP